MQQFLDFFLHIDKHLAEMVAQYGNWIYAILFLIIFSETGFVVTPFLPGDSLLFAAGAIAAIGNLDPWILFFLLSGAAILGNTVNYFIGYHTGETILHRGWIRQEYLDKTHYYFEKYGTMTIVISRFMPFVRTIAPFVAGLGRMDPRKFLIYNIFGGVLWVGLFVALGNFFGNLEFVKKNFSLITVAIIGLSLLPVLITVIKSRFSK